MSEWHFVLNQPVPLEETQYCELKEIKGHNPVNIIKNTADEYVVAFLNSHGGSIFWGIRDSDRIVTGVLLRYRERDELRRVVTEKLNQIQPPIAPSAFRVPLHSVLEDTATMNPIPDLYVVEVAVPPVVTDDLYFTGGSEAFVRTDAGRKKLSGPQLIDEVVRRLKRKTQGAPTPEGGETAGDEILYGTILKRAKFLASILRGAQVLWVDDHPGNNIYERIALKSMGITVDLAVTTEEALLIMSHADYELVISDLGRQGDAHAGEKLLGQMRKRGIRTPVVFYTDWNRAANGLPHRAFAITANPHDLLHNVIDVMERMRF